MIDKNDKWKPIRWDMFGVWLVILACIALAFATRSDAHHSQYQESPQLAKARDAFHVQRCDEFRYEGLSPDRQVCKALLSAVHRTDYHGALANRRWVSNPAFLKLLKKESSYRHNAVNTTSGACGLGQMLPCEKYGPGTCWRALRKQAVCYVRYVLGRYRTPERAWAFWLAHNWY